MRLSHSRPIGFALALASVWMISACSHVNVKQMAYEVLRQEDCRINELENFCTRNFASEYRAYERLRQEYIRSQQQTTWRVSQVEAKIVTP